MTRQEDFGQFANHVDRWLFELLDVVAQGDLLFEVGDYFQLNLRF